MDTLEKMTCVELRKEMARFRIIGRSKAKRKIDMIQKIRDHITIYGDKPKGYLTVPERINTPKIPTTFTYIGKEIPDYEPKETDDNNDSMLGSLPDEILMIIFQMCDIDSVLALSLVSHKMYRIARDKKIVNHILSTIVSELGLGPINFILFTSIKSTLLFDVIYKNRKCYLTDTEVSPHVHSIRDIILIDKTIDLMIAKAETEKVGATRGNRVIIPQFLRWYPGTLNKEFFIECFYKVKEGLPLE